MRTFAGSLAVCATLSTYGASATTTPKISGAYNVTTTTVCQASIPLTLTEVYVPGPKGPVTTDIMTINTNISNNTGDLKQLFATITFGAGKVTGAGTQWGGDLVFTGVAQSGPPGLTSQPWSISGSYSNTATQLTITQSSGSYVYQVLYSDIVDGVAQHADLVKVDTVKGCVEQGAAVHQ